MAPDGAIGMSLWSNIPDCARYMFRRQDPEFHDRARDWGGGLVVGGHNYGQGSSREQAALAALYLGIRAVVAKSFARIHRTNLVGQSILPLVFADEDDYDAVSQGDAWTIGGVRAAVEAGEEELVARIEGGGDIALRAVLSERERAVLLAGGLRELVRSHGQR
jgi:aconitate hydratase